MTSTGCGKPIEVYVPTQYDYKAIKVRCGNTSPDGNPWQCPECAKKTSHVNWRREAEDAGETWQVLMEFKDTPWKDALWEHPSHKAFLDKYPVTDLHVLFVPRTRGIEDLLECYRDAINTGNMIVSKSDNTPDSYNIGQNCGSAAGQTVDWPHVHLIFRRHGDVEDCIGGVRGVIPGKANYKEWSK